MAVVQHLPSPAMPVSARASASTAYTYRRPVRVVDAGLVLDRVAARGRLLETGIESLARKPRCGRPHLVRRLHLDAEMVERARYPITTYGRVLDQHKLERRLGDGEVGLAGVTFGRFSPEQLGVDVHRSFNTVTLRASGTRDMAASACIRSHRCV